MNRYLSIALMLCITGSAYGLRIRGTVTDAGAKGGGVAGVEVAIIGGDGTALGTATTDAKGAYDTGDIAAPNQTVTVKYVRRGYQANPTVKDISLTDRDVEINVRMVEEARPRQYYRRVAAARFGLTEVEATTLDQAISGLPKMDAAMVAEEYAAYATGFETVTREFASVGSLAPGFDSWLTNQIVEGHVTFQENSFVLSLPDAFKSGDTELQPEAKNTLTDFGSYVGGIPDGQLTIHAYTDEWGSMTFNRMLSRERAEETAGILRAFAPDSHIYSIGLGEWHGRSINGEFPAIENVNDAAARRVEILCSVPTPDKLRTIKR